MLPDSHNYCNIFLLLIYYFSHALHSDQVLCEDDIVYHCTAVKALLADVFLPKPNISVYVLCRGKQIGHMYLSAHLKTSLCKY